MQIIKGTLKALLLTFIFITPSSFALEGQYGAGIMIGEPTGFTGKYWLDDKYAVDAGLAYSFAGENAIHIHSDYLVHLFNTFKIEGHSPVIYYGGGIRFEFENDTRVGLRIPVGITMTMATRPIEFFAELVPVLDFAPETKLKFNGGLGARYYF